MDSWKPSCSPASWRKRLDLVYKARSFFHARGALEVETPSLSLAMGTDPHLDYLATRSFVDGPGNDAGIPLYLVTSPEFHMKRLLAAGWGDIWQLCKAFRGGEMGPRHNPEFSILEWYRVGWNWEQLMAEVSDLCATLAGSLLSEGARLARQAPQHLTWREAYQRHCGFDALHAELAEMVACSERLGIPGLENASREEWLDYLMVCAIEPRLGQSGPEFLTAYPAAQAALAQTEVAADGFAWARRFEMYLCGVELCNGYQELSDAAEQARRFATDLELRRSLGKRTPPVDELFLEALRQGMPACSGVALGFDRLAMLLLGLSEIGEGLAFPVQRC